MNSNPKKFRCILHGSFTKHFDLIQKIHKLFTKNGIEVLGDLGNITGEKDGFVYFENQENLDPRFVELMYLHNLKKLGPNGFSYFINPDGYIGKSASYELGIAQLTNVQCLFTDKLTDHPAYIHKNSIWSPELLIECIKTHKKLPEPKIKKNEQEIHRLWEGLMVPGSVVAVGGIIEYDSGKKGEKEVLLVKTHKWGGRYSIVGGKVKRNERLQDALIREVKEETGLTSEVGDHLCTFDQIKNSGYYIQGIQQIFVDNVVKVTSKKVKLNDEAQDYIWLPADIALKYLAIEPNAKHTLELYNKSIMRGGE